MTAIEWTRGDDGSRGETWNPTTGCDRVSPGCDNCYALTMAKRLKGMGSAKYQRDGDPRTSGPGFGLTVHEDTLDAPLRWRKPRRVFVNSMSDLFHKDVPDDFIARVFAVMAEAPQHTFQVLTKRHARMRSLLSRSDWPRMVEDAACDLPDWGVPLLLDHSWTMQRPLPNVWLGVTVEDQHWADIRIPALLDTPAAVRFLSCEPLLSSVDLTDWMPPGRGRWQCGGCRRVYAGEHRELCPGCGREGYWSGSYRGDGCPKGQPISWVIAGGESGPGARPMHPRWSRQLRAQCTAASVPYFFKQWGSWSPTAGTIEDRRPSDHDVRWDGYHWPISEPHGAEDGTEVEMRRGGKRDTGRHLDGRTWDEFPVAASCP